MSKFTIQKVKAKRARNGYDCQYEEIGNFQTEAYFQGRAFLYALHKMGIKFDKGSVKLVTDADYYMIAERSTNKPLYMAIPLTA